jgi:hypothetical protein
MKLVRDDKMELAEAFNKVTEDAMAEKDNKEMENTPQGLAADATIAAMAGPQAGGPGAPAPVQGPNPSQQNLGALLSTLRRSGA